MLRTAARSLTWTLLCGLAPAVAGPSAADLTADWVAHQAARQSARIQVALTDEDMASLAEGDVVRRIVPSGDAATAVGAIWVPAEPLHVWIAIQDVQDRPLNREQSITVRLPQDTPVRRLNYNIINAPWPITDRQSVCSVTANTDLWMATGRKVWERTLNLEDPSLALEADPEATWIERLGGGFHVVDAAGGSLVVFQVNTDPGGNVPVDLVTRFAWLALNSTLRTLAEHASDIPNHYTGSHITMALPDGNLIQPGSLTY